LRFEWTRRKLAQIGIRLKDRGTDLSRYRQKKREGNWQIASGGWLADYPDAENFLFLFYGPNGKVKTGGANATNYENPEYDKLFRQMESMKDSPRRLEIITSMMRIIQHDAPAVWQSHPVSYGLYHEWYTNVKPHQMSYNTMKYKRVDPILRTRRQREWNQPNYTPIAVFFALTAMTIAPAVFRVWRNERKV
jgi:ABC-type oligopeptide transport system substrate-binding subunit